MPFFHPITFFDPISSFAATIRYIRYDIVYLTCSKKLTGSQLCPPHGTKKVKYETKNKLMSVISWFGLVPLVGKRSLRWEVSLFVEEV